MWDREDRVGRPALLIPEGWAPRTNPFYEVEAPHGDAIPPERTSTPLLERDYGLGHTWVGQGQGGVRGFILVERGM